MFFIKQPYQKGQKTPLFHSFVLVHSTGNNTVPNHSNPRPQRTPINDVCRSITMAMIEGMTICSNDMHTIKPCWWIFFIKAVAYFVQPSAWRPPSLVCQIYMVLCICLIALPHFPSVHDQPVTYYEICHANFISIIWCIIRLFVFHALQGNTQATYNYGYYESDNDDVVAVVLGGGGCCGGRGSSDDCIGDGSSSQSRPSIY